jgi:hypothetical protein
MDHRFRHQLKSLPVSTATADAPAAGGFMICPAALAQGWMGQPWLWLAAYQHAYERAQAVVRPSRLERLQAFSWN